MLTKEATTKAQKVALFLPLNMTGHYQGLLAIADQLRDDYGDGIQCVFLVAGPPALGRKTFEVRGHRLIELEDLDEPLWDFEIEPGEDLSRPMSESDEQARLAAGKKKRLFRGAQRWPQLVARNQRIPPLKWIRLILRFSLANAKQLDEAIDSLQPDIIISDTVIEQPSVLRREQTRPWVKVWSMNPLGLVRFKHGDMNKPPSYQACRLYNKAERAQMRHNDPRAWQAVLDDWAKRGALGREALRETFSEWIQFNLDNKLEKQMARSNDTNPCRIHSPHLNIYMYPEALDYDQDDDLFEYPARWWRCDSLIRPSPADADVTGENEHWLRLIEEKKRASGLNKVVYFSLGSMFSGKPSLVQRYIDFLTNDQSDRLYLVSKGANGNVVKLNERNMLGGNYLPQKFLLQQADLAIIHGGNNSLTECFYYGKPVIVLPNMADQYDNAQRVEDLNLGKRLNLFDCSQGELLKAINDLLNDSELIGRVRRIGENARSRKDLANVSNVIRELMETRHLSEQSARKYGIKLN